MAVPRTRTSNRKKNSRRSHHALSAASAAPCANCNKMRIAHRICPHCGFYKGKQQVLKTQET